MTQTQIDRIQQTLRDLNIPAWLLYNFRDTNPIAMRLTGVGHDMHQSRRWACLVPDTGPVRSLIHRIEPHIGDALGGQIHRYSSHEQFRLGLADLLHGIPVVAMEYSPECEIPVVAKVDAGIVELVRLAGARVVSSGELIAYMEARLSDAQIGTAKRAGQDVRQVMMGAFGYIRQQILAGQPLNEYDVQQLILKDFTERGMVTDHAPIVAVNANSANPHYSPTAEHNSPIVRGDFVLIDLWARHDIPDSIYGDVTWTGFVGDIVPDRYTEIFNIVRDARDAAFDCVCRAFAEGVPVTGAQLDDAARNLISNAGYADNFTHRTGHSITTELHGAGANLDNFETHDTRRIIPGTSFSIEPGIYLSGEFGVRSELDVVIDMDGSVTATSQPLQQEVLALLQ